MSNDTKRLADLMDGMEDSIEEFCKPNTIKAGYKMTDFNTLSQFYVRADEWPFAQSSFNCQHDPLNEEEWRDIIKSLREADDFDEVNEITDAIEAEIDSAFVDRFINPYETKAEERTAIGEITEAAYLIRHYLSIIPEEELHADDLDTLHKKLDSIVKELERVHGKH